MARRVGLPSERIKILLDLCADLQSHILMLNEIIATNDPALYKTLPPIPSTEAFIAENVYQRYAGKDREATRDRMRLHRMRKAGGVYVPKSRGWKQREAEAVKIVEEDLLEVKSSFDKMAEPDLSRYSEQELIEMGLKEKKGERP